MVAAGVQGDSMHELLKNGRTFERKIKGNLEPSSLWVNVMHRVAKINPFPNCNSAWLWHFHSIV